MRSRQQAFRDAERRFPVRIRLAVPATGADGWALTPSGYRGIVNDAIAIYFADVTIANAFVARWCRALQVEIVDGLFRVRDDEPTPRVPAAHHKTP